MEKDIKQVNEQELNEVAGGAGIYGNGCFGAVQQTNFMNMDSYEEAMAYLNKFALPPHQVRAYVKMWKEKYS